MKWLFQSRLLPILFSSVSGRYSHAADKHQPKQHPTGSLPPNQPTPNLRVSQKRYDINISNGQIGMSPAYSFNCYDIKSIFNLIHHSKANIYVTKSFLLFNNWTINRFCKEYNISMEMVQLINDGN